MVLIEGNEYVTVHERLQMVHTNHEKVSIETEIISIDQRSVTVKAVLKINGEVYTAHASEVFGSTEINETSALENAETSAVGRALAFAGYGITGSVASADEVIAAKKRQPGKSPGNGKRNGNGNGNKPASPAQRSTLEKLLGNHLVTSEEHERIVSLLNEPELKMADAKAALDYFFGKSEKQGDAWIKVSPGVLDARQNG
ncbi:hypothetical protein [Fidelibacter multiformis]|uniref:hypothetical protein n=1 Tax=Fidelibacter multiformis TaxID=3377529 RepID=UPI0037DC059D